MRDSEDTIRNSESGIATVRREKHSEKEKSDSKKYKIIIFALSGVVLVAGIVIAILALGKGSKDADLNIDDTEEIAQQRYYKLHGVVDKYPINMKLTVEGNVVTGTYYYESQGPDKVLNLSGICEGSKMDLFETTAEGQQTGHFKGQLKRGIFIGDFYNAQGRCMYFRLEEK